MLVIIKIHFTEAVKLCFYCAATADAFDTIKEWDAKRAVHTVTAFYICRNP
jgi:hypothetical protein